MTSPKRPGAAGRTGRRPGNRDTRGEILTAARELFAHNGFQGASIRGVASAAGVDAALVHHYFGTKHELFLATVEIPIDFTAIVSGVAGEGIDGFGERLVRAALTAWESPIQPALVAAFRTSIADPDATRTLGEFLTLEVLGRALGALDLPAAQADRRFGLVASQMLGLIVGRYILHLPALVEQSMDDMIASVGVTIQRYLEAPLPDP